MYIYVCMFALYIVSFSHIEKGIQWNLFERPLGLDDHLGWTTAMVVNSVFLLFALYIVSLSHIEKGIQVSQYPALLQLICIYMNHILS